MVLIDGQHAWPSQGRLVDYWGNHTGELLGLQKRIDESRRHPFLVDRSSSTCQDSQNGCDNRMKLQPAIMVHQAML